MESEGTSGDSMEKEWWMFKTPKEWFDPVPYQLMVIFYSIALIFIDTGFWILAKYFIIPWLDQISVKTGASASVSGAFIFGEAISLLGFITSFIGVFVAANEDVNAGIILGENVYNLTLMVALSIIIVPPSRLKHVSLRPLIRDTIFVAISSCSIFLIFLDHQVVLFENLILIAIFPSYLVVARLLRKFISTQNIDLESARNSMETEKNKTEMQEILAPEHSFTRPVLLSPKPASTWADTAWHFLSLPVKIVFKFTIPSSNWTFCKTNWLGKMYPLTIIISFVWLGILTHLNVTIAADWGRLIGLDESIAEFLIASGSLDIAIYIILALRGDLNLILHTILGSVIYKQCLTFGIPTLLNNIFYSDNSPVTSTGGLYSLVMIMVALIVIFVEVAISKGNLKRLWGILPFILFLLQVFVEITLEYGLIQMPL